MITRSCQILICLSNTSHPMIRPACCSTGFTASCRKGCAATLLYHATQGPVPVLCLFPIFLHSHSPQQLHLVFFLFPCFMSVNFPFISISFLSADLVYAIVVAVSHARTNAQTQVHTQGTPLGLR
ncbi:hypothetical protein EJ05DRAFT_333367 [Pseudovirgaria hyperparasitica]|uniref:Uncharacterized protein n=1 Tax=Pseudovirgaria hyperparasitica TaxID=470096 RepID=A0A6A6WBA3_9PEZI|nr:uncharacterized protein EJ05DRAFT_333367 [Pseudovirgaria hyperparasitica]KAF2759116.1 hypothetical protein EJ05DRAFT_333367 [Pseudovirgaria hyperparasitica]